MLILILIDAQYSQKTVFSFQKGLNGQNHSSSGSNYKIKNSPPAKFLICSPLGGNSPTPPLTTKTLYHENKEVVKLTVFILNCNV